MRQQSRGEVGSGVTGELAKHGHSHPTTSFRRNGAGEPSSRTSPGPAAPGTSRREKATSAPHHSVRVPRISFQRSAILRSAANAGFLSSPYLHASSRGGALRPALTFKQKLPERLSYVGRYPWAEELEAKVGRNPWVREFAVIVDASGARDVKRCSH